MSNVIRSLWADESGQDLVEYALILALIAVAAIATMNTLGGNVDSTLQKVSNKLSGS